MTDLAPPPPPVPPPAHPAATVAIGLFALLQLTMFAPAAFALGAIGLASCRGARPTGAARLGRVCCLAAAVLGGAGSIVIIAHTALYAAGAVSGSL